MSPWMIRLLLVAAASVFGFFLVKLMSGLAASAYTTFTQEVYRTISIVSGGGSAAVEKLVGLAMGLVVLILAVKFLIKGRL